MFLQDPKMAESTLKITIDGDGHKIYTAGFERNNGSLVYVIDFRMDKIKKLVFKDITIETPGYKVSTTHGDIIIQSDVMPEHMHPEDAVILAYACLFEDIFKSVYRNRNFRNGFG